VTAQEVHISKDGLAAQNEALKAAQDGRPHRVLRQDLLFASQEQQVAAQEAHEGEDGLAAQNEALKAALDGTRTELFDVYQQVRV